jgi:hypothetical protein
VVLVGLGGFVGGGTSNQLMDNAGVVLLGLTVVPSLVAGALLRVICKNSTKKRG